MKYYQENVPEPFKISSCSTFLRLLQHLEPKIENFCGNIKLLQYAESERCIIVQSISNLLRAITLIIIKQLARGSKYNNTGSTY